MPTYHTKADLQWQSRVGDLIEEKWDAKLHAFAPFDEVDGWIERGGQVSAIVEIKKRTVNRGTYPTIFFALRKWKSLMQISEAFGVPGVFIVHYNDAVCYVKARDVGGCALSIGGRTDRGAPNDMEPVIEVPTHMLKELS